MIESEKISILIPDGESHLLIYIVNCFSLVKGIDLYVMSGNKANPMRFSRYISKFLYEGEVENDLSWIKAINRNIEKYDIDLILPIFEDGIKRLIKNQDYIIHKSKICSLPNLNTFNTAQDKGLLYLHLEKNNIARPKSIIVQKGDFPNERDLIFPVVAKPVKGYGGGIGVKSFNNFNEVSAYYEEQVFECNTLIQEYINGYDVSVNVLCNDGIVLAYTMQKGIAFVNGQLSPQTEFIFIENKDLLLLVKSLIKSLNWSGIANIDCRYDENDKQFKVIEINTRFWLNTDASAVAGVNFPYLYCLSSLNKPDESLRKVDLITYYNLKGLVRKIKNNPMLIFRKNTFINSPIRFAFLDPIPIIYKFIWRTKNIILAKLRTTN